MLSPRTIVVCPTSTPATSVIASSGPVGRIPTFSPRSAARGRALEVVFWAAANAVSNKSVAVAKTLLTMGIAYDQIPVSWHRQIRSLPHRPTAVSDYLNDFRIVRNAQSGMVKSFAKHLHLHDAVKTIVPQGVPNNFAALLRH